MTYAFATFVFVYTHHVVPAACNQFFDWKYIRFYLSISDLD